MDPKCKGHLVEEMYLEKIKLVFPLYGCFPNFLVRDTLT